MAMAEVGPVRVRDLGEVDREKEPRTREWMPFARPEQDTPSLNFDLQTLTLGCAEEKRRALQGTENAFLKPLSFPEPETAKDLSHFLDHEKDVPMVCPMPGCCQVFGGGACSSQEQHLEAARREDDKCTSVCNEGDNSTMPEAVAVTDEEGRGEGFEVKFSPRDQWLRHLFLSHKMVIDKIHEISSLKRYGTTAFHVYALFVYL